MIYLAMELVVSVDLFTVMVFFVVMGFLVVYFVVNVVSFIAFLGFLVLAAYFLELWLLISSFILFPLHHLAQYEYFLIKVFLLLSQMAN